MFEVGDKVLLMNNVDRSYVGYSLKFNKLYRIKFIESDDICYIINDNNILRGYTPNLLISVEEDRRNKILKLKEIINGNR